MNSMDLSSCRHETDEDGNKKPVACSLLDVSIVHVTNPALDLAYFLFSSASAFLRKTNMEDILGVYHDEFTRTLANLGQDSTVYPYR